MHALQLHRPKHPEWQPPVLQVSAISGLNIDLVWKTMRDYKTQGQDSGRWQERRALQYESNFYSQIQEMLFNVLSADVDAQHAIANLQGDLHTGAVTPREAAASVLRNFLRKP